MKTIFPWKTFADPVALDVAVALPEDALVNEDSRIVTLGGLDWTDLRLALRTRRPPQELAEKSSLAAVATLDSPGTRDRTFARLDRDADGQFVGQLSVDREAVTGRGQLEVTFVDTATGQFLARTVVWTIWYDDRQPFTGDPTRGPFPVSWVDFANPAAVDPATAETLRATTHATWYLATDAVGATTLFLNDSVEGFRRLVEYEGGGRRGRLRDLVGAQLGTELIRDLVLRAIAAVDVIDDEVPPELPADSVLAMTLEHFARVCGIPDEDRSNQYREWHGALHDPAEGLAGLTSQIAASAAQMTQVGALLSKLAKEGGNA